MSTVRAKFRVETVENGAESANISLRPVSGGSPENESFYKYTPSGLIELCTINKDAAAQFAPGDEFYVDFSKVS